jgi:ABC-2 type transport system permease protein
MVFFLAIWGAYLIRTMLLSLLGMITFWTTRVSAIFELYFAAELVLSGRLVPMSLMPPFVQQLAAYLPFQWTFAFPIESLAGDLTPAQLFSGLGMQVFWILAEVLVLNVFWRLGIRRYSAVGN